MRRVIDEKTLIEMIAKDEEFQAETLRLSKIRTQWRIDLINSYWITIQNFYIRKNKYTEAMKRDFTKK